MPPSPDNPPLTVQDWGLLDYNQALARQRQHHQPIAASAARPILALVEHPPVITITRRAADRGHLLAGTDELAALGITVVPTDRGGDITYHGPGQLVAYPILRLADFGLNLSRYMRLLERVVIDTVAEFGIHAHTEPGATGVWVSTDPRTPSAKLCAMGVRIRKNTTLHGLALNVHTHLPHFQTIIPCGLHGRPVTSLATLLGNRCPDMPTIKTTLAHRFNHTLQTRT